MALLLVPLAFGQGESTPGERELQADFDMFRSALEEAHPALSRYGSRKELLKEFDAGRKRIGSSMGLMDFELLLSELIAQIGCGNTRAQMRAEYDFRRIADYSLLPLDLFFVNERAYVRRDLSDLGNVPIGAEVVAIGSKSIKDIVGELTSYMPSDGQIQSSKLYTLSERFTLEYARIAQRSSYLVRLGMDDGRSVELVLGGRKLAQLRETERERYGVEEALPPLALSFPEPGTAMLRLNSLNESSHDGTGRTFAAFLRKAFGEIVEKRTRTLILDLRGNEDGQDELGALLLGHLLEEPFRYYDRLEVAARRLSFAHRLDVPLDWSDKLAKRVYKHDDGGLRIRKHENLNVQIPVDPVYTGQVLVLIDGGTRSAAAEFCSIAHSRGRAKFVGTETGSGYHGRTAGTSVELLLPETQIVVRIPLVKYVLAVDGDIEKARGVLPDYPIVRTIEDLLGGRDVVLTKALKLARSPR